MCMDYRVNLFFLAETGICDHSLAGQNHFRLKKKSTFIHLSNYPLFGILHSCFCADDLSHLCLNASGSWKTARQEAPLNGASCYLWSILSSCILWTESHTPLALPVALVPQISRGVRRLLLGLIWRVKPPRFSEPGLEGWRWEMRIRWERQTELEKLFVLCLAEVYCVEFHQISSFYCPEDYWYLTSRELGGFILSPVVFVA